MTALANIRRLSPLCHKSSFSSCAAKRKCTTEDTETTEKVPVLLSAASVPSFFWRWGPSPPWRRGWTAAGAFTSRRGPGEGVPRLLVSICGSQLLAASSNKFNIQVFDRGKRDGTVGGSIEGRVECYPPTLVNTHALVGPVSILTFSHPDCTVGPGVSPDPGACRPSTLCPLRVCSGGL